MEGNEPIVETLTAENSAQAKCYKDEHYKHMYSFIEAALSQVCSEQHPDENGTLFDAIDGQAKQEEAKRNFKECPQCFLLLPKTKRKCEHCKISLVEPTERKQEEKTLPSKVTIKDIGSKETSSDTTKVKQQYRHIDSAHEDGIKVECWENDNKTPFHTNIHP